MIRRGFFSLLPAVVAVVLAMVVTGLVIALTGGSAGQFYSTILSVPIPRVSVTIVNQTAMIAISAFAAAIAFRMNLFNIGVEGQYIAGSCAGAFFAGSGLVAGPAVIPATLVVAVVAGAAWASIGGFLLVGRGVSEVISAIMLNYVALTMAGYLVNRYGVASGYTFTTNPLELNQQPVGFQVVDGPYQVWALAIIAVLVAIGYWVLINHTRFGFDLRASGASSTAAAASGVDAKKMTLIAMALSGGVAGLVWMPAFFGSVHKFGIPENFQSGLGFTGLAVALLGRNRSIGILVGSLLFAFLSAQSNDLQSVGVAPEIISITQGVVVLAVVVAYEIVRRLQIRREQESVARELASARPTAEEASR
ncbi:MAG: ABC transporter permease [Nocardioidaceae bacterium]|nr:ABC transporter permease [Nocardioidaceae bacterium]